MTCRHESVHSMDPDYKTFAGYVRLCATASGGPRDRALAAGAWLARARVIAPASRGSSSAALAAADQPAAAAHNGSPAALRSEVLGRKDVVVLPNMQCD